MYGIGEMIRQIDRDIGAQANANGLLQHRPKFSRPVLVGARCRGSIDAGKLKSQYWITCRCFSVAIT